MASINTSKSHFRSLSKKVTGPTFRAGIGDVYRDLEGDEEPSTDAKASDKAKANTAVPKSHGKSDT